MHLIRIPWLPWVSTWHRLAIAQPANERVYIWRLCSTALETTSQTSIKTEVFEGNPRGARFRSHSIKPKKNTCERLAFPVDDIMAL